MSKQKQHILTLAESGNKANEDLALELAKGMGDKSFLKHVGEVVVFNRLREAFKDASLSINQLSKAMTSFPIGGVMRGPVSFEDLKPAMVDNRDKIETGFSIEDAIGFKPEKFQLKESFKFVPPTPDILPLM